MVLNTPLSAARPTAVWVVPVAALAGVGRHVLDVAGHGIPGWRLVVVCPPGPLADRLRERGAAVLTAAVGPDAGFAASVRSVRHVVRTMRPAVLHSHLAYADVVATAASVGSDVALVSTEHGIAGSDRVYHDGAARAAAMSLVHGARLRRADAVIAVSEATAEAVRAAWRPPARLDVRVIRNGVDRLPEATARAGRPGTAAGPGPHVVSLSRLAPEKGLGHLIEAFALLRADRSGARLTLAGDGPLGARLAHEVHRLGLDDAVVLPGHVDPAPLLAGADVLAQLSVWENSSYALLDALVHGLGIVASPVGGNPEMLPRQCLVPAGDHAAVAAALADQADVIDARPHLADDWPTVAQMGAAIGEVYAAVQGAGAP